MGLNSYKKGLSAAALKYIALVSMLIDHVGLVFFEAGVKSGARPFGWGVYLLLRGIGRLSFPLYVFLLGESYFHTRSRGRYLLRLGVFALLSELPFDLAFFAKPLYWGYQNVYFTLFFGLLAIWLFERATGGYPRRCGWLRAALGFAGIGAMAALAWLCKTDYGALGVLLVAAMAALRENPGPRDLVSAALLIAIHPFELCAFADFPLFRLYNGQRGRQPKYFFYLAYPGHLLLLCLLRWWVYG